MYHIVSGVKFLLGILLVFLVYNFVGVYEDPVMAIGLGSLGVFILSWGASFFLFLGLQSIFRRVDKERIVKDSYKLSLLFGIYALLNILFFALSMWSKLLGIVLLILFVMLQIFLFMDSNKRRI